MISSVYLAILLTIAIGVSSFPIPEEEILSEYFRPTQELPRRKFIPAKFSTLIKRQSGYGGGPEPEPRVPELDSDGSAQGTGVGTRPGNDYESSKQSSGSGNSIKCKRVGGGGGGGDSAAGGQGDTYRFQCEVTRKEDITLKYTHVLWLPGSTANAPGVEVVVPNYRVEEIIKAGFKSAGAGGKQPINILLQRPEKTVGAEVESPTAAKIEPEVNIQYEPPTNTLVHYPNDQAYRPLSGPILPPARQ